MTRLAPRFDRSEERLEAVLGRSYRAGRSFSFHPAAAVRQPARPERLRQEHAASLHRRPRVADRRHGFGQRRGGHAAARRPRHGVPARRPPRLAHGARQPDAADRLPRRRSRRGAPARGVAPRALPACRPSSKRYPRGALRRHAPARRDLPRADRRPEPAPDGRAVRRARCADARPDEHRAAAHLAHRAQDRDLRHAQHHRGDLPRRPRGGDDAAPGPHRRRSSTIDLPRPRRLALREHAGVQRATPAASARSSRAWACSKEDA